MATPLTIEDLDIVFNGDKRGRQYFIINTDGLRNFDIAKLDPTSPYAKIRMEIGKDSEYQEVQKNFYANLKSAKTAGYWNEYEREIGTATPTLSDGLVKLDNIREFVTSSELAANADTSINGAVTDPVDVNKTSISALDKLVARELKEAWKTYKIQKSTYDSKAIAKSVNSGDVRALYAPFDTVNDKIIKSGDKYMRVKADGKLEEFKDDKSNCQNYGFSLDGDCNEILFKCLVDPSVDGLNKCVSKIDDLMTNSGGTDNTHLQNINPEIVLALLHRFGFKATKDASGLKKIISAASWESKILPQLGLNAGLISGTGGLTSVQTLAYLQKLVDYVNSHPQILNPVDSNSFYDKGTNKDKFGKVVDPAKTNKIAIEGLTRFYDMRKSYAVNDVASLMRDIYSRYDYTVPSFLQMGGASTYDMIREQFSSGNAGAKYLENIYISLKDSLSNVDITGTAANGISTAIGDLKTKEGEILKYLEFVDKVSQVYNLFKYAPTKVSITGTDIKSLETNLATRIKEYKDQEDKVARFIQGLAKKEVSPYSENSVFDI